MVMLLLVICREACSYATRAPCDLAGPGVAFGGVVRRELARIEARPEKGNDLWFWEGKVRKIKEMRCLDGKVCVLHAIYGV